MASASLVAEVLELHGLHAVCQGCTKTVGSVNLETHLLSKLSCCKDILKKLKTSGRDTGHASKRARTGKNSAVTRETDQTTAVLTYEVESGDDEDEYVALFCVLLVA